MISLSEINRKLLTFQYSPSDANCKYACEITSKHLRERRMPGTASQKWSLLVFLPFILGSIVPESNQHWSVLLKCQEIGDILLAEKIPKESLTFLSHAIKWFLDALSQIDPVCITPKCHLLTHYPALISRYGPPKRF